MKDRLRSYHLARYALIIVSLATVVFVAWVLLSTSRLVCLNDDARDVLERLNAVPMRPWDALRGSLGLYAVLLAAVVVREIFGKRMAASVLAALSLLDLGLCVGMLSMLDYGIKYLLLVPIANGIAYLPDKIWKTAYASLVVALYIILDSRTIALGLPVFSLADYIAYHPAAERLFLEGARNALSSIAEVFFIGFLVLELQNVLEETRRVRLLNRALTESHDKLAVAYAQLQKYSELSEQTAKIKERNRLAREIHDTVGHCLTGISLGLSAAKELGRSAPEKLLDQIERLSELSHLGLLDIRRSLKELRPDMLERSALSAALRALAEEINGCSTRRVELAIEGDADALSPGLEETVYRVVQEGITNAVRHGDATRIDVDLRVAPDALRLRVADDGKGCAAAGPGFGLTHMRERVLAHDGFLEVESAPGEGFSLSVFVPLSGGQAL